MTSRSLTANERIARIALQEILLADTSVLSDETRAAIAEGRVRIASAIADKQKFIAKQALVRMNGNDLRKRSASAHVYRKPHEREP